MALLVTLQALMANAPLPLALIYDVVEYFRYATHYATIRYAATCEDVELRCRRCR